MRHFVTICALVGALLIPVVDLHGADQSSSDDNVYDKAMARADEAGTLILFVYSKDTGHNLSDKAVGILLARGRGTVTAGMVVQYVPISSSDQRYAQYRSRIEGDSYPFWVLAKPDGEFLAGGDYDTVVDDDSGDDDGSAGDDGLAGDGGSGGWDKTVARFARQFPPVDSGDRERIARTLARAQAALDAEDLGKAKSSLGKLGGVWYPNELVQQCTALRNAYDSKLHGLTERPEQLAAEGKLVEASLAYQRLIDAFGGRGNEGRAAREALRELLTEHPEIRELFTERLRQQRAQAAAQAAAEAAGQGGLVVLEVSEDQAGEQAEGDTTTPASETPDEDALERRAASLVKIAQQYHGQDMIEEAKAKLAECVEKYPDTAAAQQARGLLRQW